MNTKIIGIIIVLLILGGAVVFLKNQSSTNQQAVTTTVEPTTAPTSEVMSPTGGKMMEKEVTVNLTDSGFDPKAVTVKIGTKVVWVNKTNQTGNVSSAKHPTHLVYPPLNLGNFEPGKSVSLVFDKAGSYSYHDHLDPSRFGTVVVE